MDRYPLIPENDEDHEILPLITEILQDTRRAGKYPQNIAENYKKYKIDGDFMSLASTGLATIKILETLETPLNDILDIEEELMRNHALALVQKDLTRPLLDDLQLKRFEFFEKLSENATKTYELIERTDLYPNKIEQYLDFTYNPYLHTCDDCIPTKTEETKIIERKVKQKRQKRIPQVSPTFKVEPTEIIFKNYEKGQVYKQKLKLRNITRFPQNFNYYLLPKESPFRLKMLTDSHRVAPGMSAEFQVEFSPQTLINCTETIKFRTVEGVDLRVLLSCSRDPPKLVCYVFNPYLPFNAIRKPRPGSKYFSNQRQNALNFTIDCGTCLLGNHSLSTVVMKNTGNRGSFFITTENEWVFNELNETVTRKCEITQGCFTIFPSFFEIGSEEVGQIVVAFVPDTVGVFTERFIIICDNNCHLEIEILGDCILYFDKFLRVNMYLLEDTFSYNLRTISITLQPRDTESVIFSIINNSPLHFNYYWLLKHNTEDQKNKVKMNPDWIQILYGTKFLPPFSITDLVVQLTADSEEENLYYIFLSLYLKNIPRVSLEYYEMFTPDNQDIQEHEYTCESFCTLNQDSSGTNMFTGSELGDVHIFELEINCTVALPTKSAVPPTPTNVVSSNIPEHEAYSEPACLQMSPCVLNFGIIPKGVSVSKSFNIENLSDSEIDWKIIEIHCTGDSNMCVSSATGNLSKSGGTLMGRHMKKIKYTVEAREPVNWVSILVLFSCPSCTCQTYILESVSLVAYDVAEIKISISTENHQSVLCPREFIYVDIPTVYTIYVHNSGPTIGCFYFLKPTGEGAENVRLRFSPQSGTVEPGATVDVKVELTAFKDGIYENIYVPCFVGDPDRLIALRILCSVATINVYFYLPDGGKGHMRYLWPPKNEMATWDYSISRGEGGFLMSDKGEWSDNEEVRGLDQSLLSLIATDSVAATYPTVKIKNIQVKKATKLTFYMENVTPVKGHFSVEASNYGPENDCLNHILVKAKTRTPEFFWEKACLNGYGIVIEPICHSSDIMPYEVKEINLWIYANTWGKYLEEIIVEINDLTPFCFNLIIEVVGLPVEFPFARNTTLPCPTLRFENIAYATETTTRSFTVTNTSAITIQMNWQIYATSQEHLSSPTPLNFLLEFVDDSVGFVMARNFYGCEACIRCIDINPRNFTLKPQETITIDVTISALGFLPSHDKTIMKYTLVGFIALRNTDKFRENYFKRLAGVDFSTAKVEVLVTMEQPIMQIDISSDETVINIFVNNLLLKQEKIPEVYLLLRNVDMSSINFSIDIEKPFKIIEARTIPGGITDKQNLILERNDCLQVMVTCHFTCEDLLDYAEFIYNCEDKSTIENFTSVISKDLNVFQAGTRRQMIPFQIRLHYPHIVVKPQFIRWGECLMFQTKKSIISIYNMTGAVTNFEILKTTEHDDFEVSPNYGTIEANTGVNKQFIDVAVYFTPRHCKRYNANLRIVTNIPLYYIDVPVTGHGSNNEKFID